MNDLELLKFAARAYNDDSVQGDRAGGFEQIIGVHEEYGEVSIPWNPLTDDGDALRLATELGFNIYHAGCSVYVEDLDSGVEVQEGHERDKMMATRRAIVRAAAEVGKDMK